MRFFLAVGFACLCLVTEGAVYDWTYTPPGPEATDARLDGHVVRRFHYAYSVLACARACLQLQTCSSYNYNKDRATCELNDVVTDGLFPLVNATGYQYFGRTDITPPAEGLPACASRPCLNGGMCQERPGAAPPYFCFCAATDYHGEQCHQEVQDGGWGAWGPWGSCSESCGVGLRVRQRQCDHPVPTHGRGSPCAGLAEHKGQCNKQRCPSWSEWTPVGNCSTYSSCGSGTQTYIRECEGGGTVDVDPGCTGPTNTTHPCYSRSCRSAIRLSAGPSVGEGRLEVYDTGLGEWGTVCQHGWSAVNSHIVCRQLGFVGTAPDKDGNPRPPIACSTAATAMAESKFTVRCPPGCAQDSASKVWGTGIYTSDSSICRAAVHDQRVSNQLGGDVIVHKIGGASAYNGSNSADVVSLSYSSYTESIFFSGGTAMAAAQGDVPIVLSGVQCLGTEDYLLNCPSNGWRHTPNCDHTTDVVVHCQVDGGWGGWGPWAPCPKECGGHCTRERQRVCDRPPPANLGKPCDGPSVQTKKVYRDPC